MVPHLNAFISGLYSCGMIQLHTIFHVGVSQFIQSLIKISGVKRQPDKSLPKLQPFTVISKNACVVLGCNAGPHTLQGTNTYLIGTDNGFQDDDCGVKTKIDTKASSLKMKPSRCSGKMLIDTGEFSTSDEYIKLLLDVVFPVTNTTHLTHILLTHYHHDHIGGVEPLLAALQERNMLPLPTVYKRHCSGYHYSAKDANEEPAPGPASADSTWQPIAHRQVFRVPSDDGTTKTTVVALFTPGHTADHVSFVLEEDRALLSGDCILGCSSSVFDNLSVYMATLQRLKYIVLKGVSAFDGYDDNNEGERVPNSDVDSGAMSCIPCKDTTTSVTDSCETDEAQIMHIYPGHGPILRDSALETVNNYIHHRELREQQIIAAMSKLKHIGYLSSWHIMSLIYTKPFPFVLKMAAQHNVLKHLAKLEQDGIVVRSHKISYCQHPTVVVPGANILDRMDLDLWCLVK